MIGDLDDMRFSLAKASCAVVIGALLAGCSTTGMQAGPATSSGITPLSGQKVSNSHAQSHKISPLKLLELEVSGRVPGQLTHKALVKMLQQLKQNPHGNFIAHRASKTTIRAWTDDTEYSYLLGMNKKNKTEAAVNVSGDGCIDPITVKVDHSQNVWVSCEENSSYNGGAEAEFSSAGAATAQYAWSDPYSCEYYTNGCYFQYSAGFDGAANSSYAFSELSYNEQYVCPSYYCYYVYSNPGFFYWPIGSPFSQATFIQVPASAGVDEIYYMDLDANGNIWFDYEGYSGVGIGEITNPTTSPNFVNVIPSTGIGFPGGVYVSNHGATLNVTDQETRITTQYSISGSSLNETGTIGPTKLNAEGQGDPVAGGFNSADSVIGFGDASGWDDTCTTASLCKILSSANLPYGAEGYAFTPSDK